MGGCKDTGLLLQFDNKTDRDWQEDEDLSITHLGLQNARQDTLKRDYFLVCLHIFSFYVANKNRQKKKKIKQMQSTYID